MPNSYFKFKQFTIDQDQCAMKVSTLACILGAYAEHPESVNNILDIGTGTGLLALMMAQKYPDAGIDAIEIEDNAVVQAKNNIKKSEWRDQITVEKCNFLRFDPAKKYDLIISNPPFFENYQKTNDNRINLARHVDELTIQKLMEKAATLLSSSGLLFVLLPPPEMKMAEQCAATYNLCLHKKMNIFNFKDSPIKANVCAFGFPTSPAIEENLIIRDDQNDYTDEFIRLLKPYYLYL